MRGTRSLPLLLLLGASTCWFQNSIAARVLEETGSHDVTSIEPDDEDPTEVDDLVSDLGDTFQKYKLKKARLHRGATRRNLELTRPPSVGYNVSTHGICNDEEMKELSAKLYKKERNILDRMMGLDADIRRDESGQILYRDLKGRLAEAKACAKLLASHNMKQEAEKLKETMADDALLWDTYLSREWMALVPTTG